MGMDLHKISSRVIQVLGIQLAPTGARIFDIAAAPTDGTSGTGAGLAAPGSLLLRTDVATAYLNVGTKASPTWVAITHA